MVVVDNRSVVMNHRADVGAINARRIVHNEPGMADHKGPYKFSKWRQSALMRDAGHIADRLFDEMRTIDGACFYVAVKKGIVDQQHNPLVGSLQAIERCR